MTSRKAASPTPIDRSMLRRFPLPEPGGEASKDERGRVLVVGGSDEIPGAVVLAAIGALRAGAGKLTAATSRNAAIAVAVAVPEGRVIGLRSKKNGELDARAAPALDDAVAAADAILVGPGMMEADGGVAIVRRVLRADGDPVLVVDAAPMAAFGPTSRGRGARPIAGGEPIGQRRVIITPHAGEMARLCGLDRREVAARPALVARETALRLGVTVVLKGSETHVVGPDGIAFVNREAGCVGLGTSGSGDTLAGVITGLAARGVDPVRAACWGVYLHGRAGDALARRVGRLGFLARELLEEIPRLMDDAPRSRRG